MQRQRRCHEVAGVPAECPVDQCHRPDIHRRIAEEFSSRLKSHVAVLCGIHYDGLNPEQVEGVNRLCDSLARRVLPLLEEQVRLRPEARDNPEHLTHQVFEEQGRIPR